ncbi:MAG: hypothetical protein AABX11_07650 [Nanoarchaeota archaeon]
MERNSRGDRGQATLWIIVGIAIVILIAVLFVMNRGPKGGQVDDGSFDINSYIEKCVRDDVLDVVDEILPHGGFLVNRASKNYNNISIEYLCYNQGFFKPCINQHPDYFNEVNNVIKENIVGKINSCFESLDATLVNRGAEVSGGMASLNVNIVPDKIVVKINRSMNVIEKEVFQQYDKFDFEITSPIYMLMRTALEVVNSEAQYCYFEYVGYMLMNKDLIIRKTALGDSTKIYSMEDYKTGKKLNIAVRGCAIPPGF